MSESFGQDSQFDSEDDIESIDDHLQGEPILADQRQSQEEDTAQPDTRYDAKTIINVDSISRTTEPTLSYQKVKTYDTWLFSRDHQLFVVLSNPMELPKSSMYSNTQTYGDKKIPATIIGFIRWVSDKKGDQAPHSVAGIPASEILFQPDMKEPQLKLNLFKYNQEDDEAEYIVENIEPQQDEALGVDSKSGQAYQFYIITDRTEFFKNSNHFKVSFGKSFQNVVKIRMISSEIPTPLNREQTHNSNQSGSIRIPNRNLEIPFEYQKMDSSTVESMIVNGAKNGEVVSLFIPQAGESESRMKIFFLETHQHEIQHIEENLIDMRYSVHYQPGKLLWLHVNHPFEKYSDKVVMVQRSYEYKCILEPRSVPFPIAEKYTRLYLIDADQTLLGYVSKVIASETENTIFFSSEKDDLGTEMLGKTISISNPGSTGTLISIQRLGPSSFIHIQPVFDYPIKSNNHLYIQWGVFIQEEFSIDCEDGEIETPLSSTESHEILGNMKHNENGQTQLSFFNDELPYSASGYNIESIEDKDHEQSNQVSRHIYGIERSSHNNPIIELAQPEPHLQKGDVCRINLPNRSEWCSVVSNEHHKIELDTPWQEDFDRIDQMFVKDRGIPIARGDGCENISSGILRHPVESGDFHLDILGTYPVEKSWILVLQPTAIDGNTPMELNVVYDVSRNVSTQDQKTPDVSGKIKELEQLVTLRFPIQNSIDQGATVRQTYLFLEIHPREQFNASTIWVSSSVQLDKKLPNDCVGCINWMSSVLLEHGGKTFWASEEPIIIEAVSHIRGDIYELSVSPPLEHHYPWDSYLVIFVDIDMTPCPPSSINFNDRDQWRTIFLLEENDSEDARDISDQFPQGKYRIEGMIGENIPIHGLSRSDEIARELVKQQNYDRLGKNNLDVELLTHPNTKQECRTVSYIPDRISAYMKRLSRPYIAFEGRFGGRGGNVIHIPEQKRSVVNVEHLTWYNHQSCPKTRVSSATIESSRLPRSLQDADNVVIRVSPKESQTKQLDVSNAYSYFFLCTPYLDNLETVTHVLRKPNTNSSSSMEAPQMNKLGLFAKIQCKYKKDQSIMFNTFIKTDNDLPGVPIEEDFEWIFLWPDGREVDFGNQNVSFTLEITESLRILS